MSQLLNSLPDANAAQTAHNVAEAYSKSAQVYRRIVNHLTNARNRIEEVSYT